MCWDSRRVPPPPGSSGVIYAIRQAEVYGPLLVSLHTPPMGSAEDWESSMSEKKERLGYLPIKSAVYPESLTPSPGNQEKFPSLVLLISFSPLGGAHEESVRMSRQHTASSLKACKQPYLEDGLLRGCPRGHNLGMHSPTPIRVHQVSFKHHILQDILGHIFLPIHQPAKPIIDGQSL